MKKNDKNIAVNTIDGKIRQTHALILSKPHLRELADTDNYIPEIYNSGGKIKLIVIGQDPTIANKSNRKKITTVLDLDKPGKMQRYIFGVCEKLEIDPFKELYATNLFKNFFNIPPAYSTEVLNKFFGLWFPILREEISQFPKIPIITLGNNLLEFLLAIDTDKCVRNYWGYTENWRMGINLPFKHIYENENLLGRKIFPFPRQPSYLKQFFLERCKSYINYVYTNINADYKKVI